MSSANVAREIKKPLSVVPSDASEGIAMHPGEEI